MKRKIVIAVCSIFVLCLCVVSKWQLAIEEGEEGAQQDHLIGVFVTKEAFDIDSYLAKDYVFEGVKGIPFFYYYESLADEPGNYSIPINDEAISNVNFNVSNGKDEDSVLLEGTMYVSPSNEEAIYHINPVYQSGDGSVYAVSGDSMSSDSYSVGFEQSMSLDEVIEITENGKSKKESVLVKITISVMQSSEKIVIIQMGAENTPLARTEYEPGNLPESYAAQAETAYLVVETYRHDEDGGLEISREVCNRNEEEFVTFYGREDGVCVEERTPVEW